MKLEILFPIIGVMFTDDKNNSLTISQAQRLKDYLKNKAQQIDLSIESAMYVEQCVVINGKVEKSEVVEPTFKPNEFKKNLSDLSKIKATAALLGSAITLKDVIDNHLTSNLQFTKFEEYESVFHILRETSNKHTHLVAKQSFYQDFFNKHKTIDQYIEALMRNHIDISSRHDLIRNMFEALEAEAETSVYGPQMRSGSIFYYLINSKSSDIELDSKSNKEPLALMRIIKPMDAKYFPTLTKQEWLNETNKFLYGTHDKAQRRKNHFLAALKNYITSLKVDNQREIAKASNEIASLSKELENIASSITTQLMKEASELRIRIHPNFVPYLKEISLNENQA